MDTKIPKYIKGTYVKVLWELDCLTGGFNWKYEPREEESMFGRMIVWDEVKHLAIVDGQVPGNIMAELEEEERLFIE